MSAPYSISNATVRHSRTFFVCAGSVAPLAGVGPTAGRRQFASGGGRGGRGRAGDSDENSGLGRTEGTERAAVVLKIVEVLCAVNSI